MKYLLLLAAALLIAADAWFLCMTWEMLHIATHLRTQMVVIALSLLIQPVVVATAWVLWRIK